MIETVTLASKRRDDIAHGIVHHVRGGDVEEGAFLFPPYYNSGGTSAYVVGDGSTSMWFADFRFTSADILETEKRFGELKTIITDQYIINTARGSDGAIPFIEAVTGAAAP